ncbi:hypothetical protein, partial [Staphylococcus argenteus]
KTLRLKIFRLCWSNPYTKFCLQCSVFIAKRQKNSFSHSLRLNAQKQKLKIKNILGVIVMDKVSHDFNYLYQEIEKELKRYNLTPLKAIDCMSKGLDIEIEVIFIQIYQILKYERNLEKELDYFVENAENLQTQFLIHAFCVCSDL